MNSNHNVSSEQKGESFSDREALSEKDFIQDNKKLSAGPWWLWIFIIVAVFTLIWGTNDWHQSFVQSEKSVDPFLRVTNREFSLFLWQFPSYMRVNSSTKNDYLTGFLATSESFSPETAEEYVVASADLLFLYHTWNRLLAPDFISRPIPPKEFKKFLDQLTEWRPENWSQAPHEYIQLVNSESYTLAENLQVLPLSTLPLVVRRAFLGWKNYFIEGQQINRVQPTYEQIKTFLAQHPHYERSYWRNIREVYGKKVAGKEYLAGFLHDNYAPNAPIPKEQVSSFLKVAYYNADQAEKNR